MNAYTPSASKTKSEGYSLSDRMSFYVTNLRSDSVFNAYFEDETRSNIEISDLGPESSVKEAYEVKKRVEQRFVGYGMYELYLSNDWPDTCYTSRVRGLFHTLASDLFFRASAKRANPTLFDEALQASNPLKACMNVWVEGFRQSSRQKLLELMETGMDFERFFPESEPFRDPRQMFEEYLDEIEETFTEHDLCADGKSFRGFLLAVVPVYFQKSMRSVLSSINSLSTCETKRFIVEHRESFLTERAAWNKAKEEAEEKAAQEKAALEKAAQEKAAQEKAAQEKAAEEKAAQEKAAQEKAAEVKEAEARATETDNVKTEAADEESSNECVKPTTAELNSHTDLFPCSLETVARVLVTGNRSQLESMRKAPRISITVDGKTYGSNQAGVYPITVRGADGSKTECEVPAYYVPNFPRRQQSSGSSEITFEFTVVTIEKDCRIATSKEGAKFFMSDPCPKATISTDQSFPELRLSE